MSRKSIICIGCPKGCRMDLDYDDDKINKITGFSCPTGEEYARKEFTNPTRILPTTVKVIAGELPLVSVKTVAGIPKSLLFPAMKEIASIKVKAPVKIGQVIKPNLLNTGVDLVATRKVDLLIKN